MPFLVRGFLAQGDARETVLLKFSELHISALDRASTSFLLCSPFLSFLHFISVFSFSALSSTFYPVVFTTSQIFQEEIEKSASYNPLRGARIVNAR